MRGMLTKEVKEVALEKLGREITQVELRLMPYLFTRLCDNAPVDYIKITQEEADILLAWEADGLLDVLDDKLVATHACYDALAAILKVGYCSAVLVDEVIPF